MGQASAEQALRALELLVGERTVKAKGPDGQAWPGEGRASSQWHPSHAHLLQRIAVDVPGAPRQHLDHRPSLPQPGHMRPADGIGATGSPVPRQRLQRAHATSTPGTARAAHRQPPG